MKLYHGTNQNFDEFKQDKARILNDYYGGGVAYFTDNLQVAHTYAKSMVKSKGGDPFVFEVDLTISKLFDVDKIFQGKSLSVFYNNKAELEEFCRGAGLMKAGTDKHQVMASVELGNVNLTGDQVFKGLSAGMNKTAYARQKLISLGYDTLRYNGGVNMNATKHNVYIVFKSSNIHIREKYYFDSNGKKYKKVK